MNSFGRIASTALILILVFACAAAAQHAKFNLLNYGEAQAEPANTETKPGETTATKEDGPEEDASHTFVHPVTSPYYHEDSFVTNDVRVWYLYHKFAKYGLDKGHLQIVAVQFRLAITDQLQFVAYKDGYSWWDEGSNATRFKDGCNDIGFGLKWNFIQDWDEQMHAAVGVGYEVASGRQASLHDDQEWRVWASFNKGFGAFHFGGTFNFFYAPDKAADTNVTLPLRSTDLGSNNYITWHAHADWRVCDVFSPVVEFNGYHVVSEGAHNLVDFQGTDAVNIAGGKKNYVITGGIGAAVRPGVEGLEFRGAYEVPLTDKDDIWGWRFTVSAVISF